MGSKASNKYLSKKMDGEGRPIAIYKFKYRSEGKNTWDRLSDWLLTQPADALRSLLIIPRDPYERPSAPTPDSASRRYSITTIDPDEIDLNTASPEEKALMARYLYGLRVRANPITLIPHSNQASEQDKGSPQVKPEHGVKREGGASAGSRKSQPGRAVVVDLTED